MKLRSANNGKGRIVYQIIHRREVKRITSRILLDQAAWDSEKECPTIDCPKMRVDLDHLRRIIARMDEKGSEYSASEVADEFAKIGWKGMFFGLAENEISLKLAKGCRGTAKNYRTALRQYQKFRCDINISVEQIDSIEMEEFQSWLKEKGVCSNTISNYMRTLRCIYNRAVVQGLCVNRYPFATVYTGVAKTKKRAISENDLRTIAHLDLLFNPTLEYDRDIFILSFYLMGMAFVDLAMLKKTDYSAGRIIYRRQKTGQTINVLVCKKAKVIIDKLLAEADSPFLLNIINSSF